MAQLVFPIDGDALAGPQVLELGKSLVRESFPWSVKAPTLNNKHGIATASVLPGIFGELARVELIFLNKDHARTSCTMTEGMSTALRDSKEKPGASVSNRASIQNMPAQVTATPLLGAVVKVTTPVSELSV